MNSFKNAHGNNTSYKKRMTITKISGLVASCLLAACSATAISFMDRAQDFAMGTWECGPNTGMGSIGVKPDGTVLMKSPELEALGFPFYKYEWRLENGELKISDPTANGVGDLVVDVDNLEQGTIAEASVEELEWGPEMSISNVKWDFEKRTASFQGTDPDGNLGDVVECRKTSDGVDFGPSMTD